MSLPDSFEEEDRPEGPVRDSGALLEEGRRFQQESGIPPLLGRRPRFLPWVLLAVLMMLVSLGIELFWPLPGRHGPLPPCGQVRVGSVSCQKVPARGAPLAQPPENVPGQNGSPPAASSPVPARQGGPSTLSR